MAVAVVETNITDRNEITTVTSNAATADVDALAEVFTIENVQSDMKVLIGGTGAAADADITYSFGTSEMWNSKEITGTVTKNTEAVIVVDTANCKLANGTILLTLTPGATDKLLTDHAAYVKVIENVG
jgi:hypothetical protein